jgi:glucosyl-3-phosphoglycerate synthase
LHYDRHQEEVTVETFEKVILEAGSQYLEDPAGTQIPDWTRALAVVPDLREKLLDAVISDMAQARSSLTNVPTAAPENFASAAP